MGWGGPSSRRQGGEFTPLRPSVARPEISRRSLARDRKSTRLNSSHSQISYAVFCLKKKEKTFVGPIISEEAARRIEESIQAAVKAGGRLLGGGIRNGRMVSTAVPLTAPRVPQSTAL